MATIEAMEKGAFETAMAASGRSPEIPESADVYGWLAGSWELDVRCYLIDVTDRHIKGEAHFAWVLEGRAVQDVWIMPRVCDRMAAVDKSMNMYGTTLRVWDPAIQAWRVTWINGVNGRRDELIGRWSGKEIVQIGAHADGTPIRWIFSEIAHDSFRWTGEALEGEFLARRLK